MRESPPPSNAREPTATELLCLEIDIELRDVWELLDQRPDMWDDLRLAAIASAMRVAYDRGHCQGKVAGYDERYYEGYEDGHYAGYEDGYQEGYEHGHEQGGDQGGR